MNDDEKYKESYGLDGKIAKGAKKRRENALKEALDIRKFEIELYWKRTTYFWTLLAAIFVAFFTTLNTIKELDNKEITLLIISCIGFIVSLSWFLVNKGSKQWQENWENHVFLLEDDYMGALYKSVLDRPTQKYPKDILANAITKPSNYSVSKINQFVSLYITILWLGILIYCVINISNIYLYTGEKKELIFLISYLLIATCVFFTYGIIKCGKSHVTLHTPEIETRRVILSAKKNKNI